MADRRDSVEHNGSFNDFFSVVFRRKWIIIAPIIAAALVIAYLYVSNVPMYFSYSKLLVNRGEQKSAYTQGVQLLSWEEELTSEREIISSSAIYLRAHELLRESPLSSQIGEDYEITQRRVSTHTPGKSHIINITYEDPDSIAAQEAVRALTKAYCEFRSEIRTLDPLLYLQAEIDTIQAEIVEYETKRADFLAGEGSVDLVQERNHLLSEKRSLSTALETARADWAIQHARLVWTQGLVDRAKSDKNMSMIMPLQPSGYFRENSALSQISDIMVQTRSELITAKGQYTDDHPRVLALTERIDELYIELIEAANGYISQLEAYTGVTEAKLNSLQGSLDFINEQLSGFPHREAALASLDRTLGNLRDTYDVYVRKRVDVMTTKIGASPWDVTLLEDASTPVVRRSKDYVRFLLLLIVSSLIGLGLAFAFDNLDHTLKGRSEAEALLRVPVLASVSKHDQ